MTCCKGLAPKSECQCHKDEQARVARSEANYYAAALYAITNKRPDLSPTDRAELAAAVVDCQRARNLI